MKASTVRMGGGSYELVIESQSKEEDQIILDLFNNGEVSALGEGPGERKQLIIGKTQSRRE